MSTFTIPQHLQEKCHWTEGTYRRPKAFGNSSNRLYHLFTEKAFKSSSPSPKDPTNQSRLTVEHLLLQKKSPLWHNVVQCGSLNPTSLCKTITQDIHFCYTAPKLNKIYFILSAHFRNKHISLAKIKTKQKDSHLQLRAQMLVNLDFEIPAGRMMARPCDTAG